MTNYVYLLHFSQPISAKHTTQHYIGSADDVYQRLEQHRAGQGARLTQVANERGIGYKVVRTWQTEPGQARQLERKLKNRKEGPALCPVCSILRSRNQYQPALLAEFTLEDLHELKF